MFEIKQIENFSETKELWIKKTVPLRMKISYLKYLINLKNENQKNVKMK